MKKRIAILIHGGVGTGDFGQGYPMLPALLIGIGKHFDVIVFSHSHPAAGFTSHLKVLSPARRISGGLRRWMVLVRMISDEHRRQRFDLMFPFWGYPSGVLGVMLAKVLRVPSVVYLLGGDSTGLKSINYGVLYKPLHRRIAKYAYLAATSVLVLSRYQIQELNKFGITRNFKVIPWGVDLSIYHYRSSLPGANLEVIHVGHLSAVKDQDTLLKAFALIRKSVPATLRIYGGDAGKKTHLLTLVAELGIAGDVYFMDMVPYGDMSARYRESNLMLHTSLSEGQSLAVTEGAASGVLLAGTSTGLLHDLSHEAAVKVPPGDYTQLASRVMALLGDPDEWERKTKKAREWCETHSLEWSIDSIVQELHVVLQGRR